MKCIPVKTRKVQPPKDDLFSVMKESLPKLHEGDVVLVSSKVVAINEGRCVPVSDSVDKAELVAKEADILIETEYRDFPLTVTRNTFLGAAGIDESNADGHYILLPEDSFASAKGIHDFLINEYDIKNLGVIVTDSRSQPFRYGAIGVALGFWGFAPLQDHIGKKDLFGRAFKYERSNIPDALAAMATLVGGETDECQPVVIARDVPNLDFNNKDSRNELFTTPEDDSFRVLYKKYLSGM